MIMKVSSKSIRTETMEHTSVKHCKVRFRYAGIGKNFSSVLSCNEHTAKRFQNSSKAVLLKQTMSIHSTKKYPKIYQNFILLNSSNEIISNNQKKKMFLFYSMLEINTMLKFLTLAICHQRNIISYLLPC